MVGRPNQDERRMMKSLALLATALTLSAGAAQAEDIPTLPETKAQVVTCLGAMDQDGGTTWNQCMEMLFAPCADREVATQAHLDCLLKERDDWLIGVEREQERTAAAITPQGQNDLRNIMSQWRGYVRNKCATAASQNTGIKADVAQAGCEMSEMALVTDELMSCVAGRSLSPYCIPQE